MAYYFNVEHFNVAANGAAFLILLMLLVASLLGGDPREKVFRWFFTLVLLSLVNMPIDFILLAVLEGMPGDGVALAMRVLDFVSFMFLSLLMYATGMYFYEFFSEKTRVPRAFVRLQIFLALGLALVVVAAQFTPFLSSIDAANEYHQGAYLAAYIFPILTLISCTALTLANIRLLKPREWVSLLFYTTLAIVCEAIEAIYEELWVTYLATAVALFLMYVNIQLELWHRLREREAELAEGRIAVMLSQIQPHFIFNTLSSIADVCGENPLAQKCLSAFSDYLRGNMDALSQKMPIPFERELEHVRQYLWLEQLRFEERLRIEYDIRAKNFMLPVLTLQPIVENAVRHGITQRLSGGTIAIRSEESGSGYRIVVEDDGVGFDPEAPPQDGRNHTGIENVRARLAAQCGGRVEIESAPGRGTRVVIEIPA